MRKRVTFAFYSLGMLVLIIAGIVYLYVSQEKDLLPVNMQEPSGAQQEKPSLSDYWRKQADTAEQAGLLEAAANYRARISVYTASLSAPAPAFPEQAASLPQIPYRLYVRADNPDQRPSAPLAKHEPASGTYLGMLGADRRVGYDVTKIENVYGKKHAIYLSYVGWRKVQTDTDTYFPKRTADRVKALDGALQIGWEPRYGLDDVLDDEYVRRFAREAKASGIPIFLRYASEMNGAWVPWHGDPQKYIEKWRLIHDIMKEEAPNVAMVWSPNFAPADNIEEYYPGDAYVDWVGFSLYSTPGSEEDLTRTVIDYFAPLYARYSHKPIMISEGAIAHTLLKKSQTYWSWAEGQLGYMYGFLPQLFPQVKAMTYFNFSRAQAVRTNSDYVFDLGENPYTDGMYKKIIATDRFLSRVEQGQDPIRYAYYPLDVPVLSEGRHIVMVYTKLNDGSWPFAVALYQGSRRVGISYEMPWEIQLDLSAGQPGEQLRMVAYNERMEPAAVSSLP